MHVSFSELSSEAQDHLVQICRGNKPEGVEAVFHFAGGVMWAAFLVVALASTGTLTWWIRGGTVSPLTTAAVYAFGALIVAGCAASLVASRKVVEIFGGGLRPTLVLLPPYVIHLQTARRPVEILALEGLRSRNETPKKLTLVFEDGEVAVPNSMDGRSFTNRVLRAAESDREAPAWIRDLGSRVYSDQGPPVLSIVLGIVGAVVGAWLWSSAWIHSAQRWEGRHWAGVQRVRSATAYYAYLRQSVRAESALPSWVLLRTEVGEHVLEAEREEEGAALREATTVKKLEEFIRHFPKSKHLSQARLALAELKVKAGGGAHGLYAEAQGNGPNGERARKVLRQLCEQEARRYQDLARRKKGQEASFFAALATLASYQAREGARLQLSVERDGAGLGRELSDEVVKSFPGFAGIQAVAKVKGGPSLRLEWKLVQRGSVVSGRGALSETFPRYEIECTLTLEVPDQSPAKRTFTVETHGFQVRGYRPTSPAVKAAQIAHLSGHCFKRDLCQVLDTVVR
jgi:hypothetical protein